jgi:hypothetical protein
MPHQETLARMKSTIPFNKELKLNGSLAIGYNYHDDHQKGTVYFSENIIMVVISGQLKLNYGKDEYIVEKNQMSFIRNKTLIEYETIITEEVNKVEFILFLLTYELIKEFIKISSLKDSMHPNQTEIAIDTVNKNLQKYLDSLTDYFEDSIKLSDNLVKLKMLELLFIIASFHDNFLLLLLDLKKSFKSDLISIIEENINNSLSINELAVMAGRSLSSFRRDFLSIYNMTMDT